MLRHSVIAAAFISLCATAHAAESPEAAVDGFAQAWNAHDMDAFGALFWEEATFVNRGGRLAVGRDAIREHQAKIHQTHLKSSVSTNSLESLRAAGSDAAVAIVRSDLSGSDKAPAEVVRTRLTFVLERRDGDWRIARSA